MKPALLFGVAAGIATACSSVPANEKSPDGGGPIGLPDGPPTACVAVSAPPSFQRFKIADAAPTGGFPSIQLAADGTPAIVFVAGEFGEEHIVAARLDNAGGADAPRAEIVPLSQAGRTVTPPRVTTMPDGRIVTAYVATSDATNYHGRCVTWTGRVGDRPIDTEPFPDATGDGAPAVVVDRSGRSIAAFLYADFSMRLVFSPGEPAPSRETVAIGVWSSASTMIDVTVDADGQPVLVGTQVYSTPYAGGETTFLPSSRGFTVWRRAGTGWAMDRLAPEVLGVEPRVRLSHTGELTIFFASPRHPRLSRAVRQGSSWRIEAPILDADGRSVEGTFADVAFGPAGEIQALFLGDSGLSHAVFDGCRWSETVVDSEVSGASIAVDATGRPWIAYQKQIGVLTGTGTEISEVWYARPGS